MGQISERELQDGIVQGFYRRLTKAPDIFCDWFGHRLCNSAAKKRLSVKIEY
jgi:hypothetical protein